MIQKIDCLCETCGERVHGYLRPEPGVYPPCPKCGTTMVRLWTADSTPTPHGDEIDIRVRHGVCWPDGTPRRFTSKTELARVAKRAGWENHVEHVPPPGGDRSKHTVRWI